MGQASSSAAATSANNNTGGNINSNQPNVLVWVVGALVALLGMFMFFKRKHK